MQNLLQVNGNIARERKNIAGDHKSIVREWKGALKMKWLLSNLNGSEDIIKQMGEMFQDTPREIIDCWVDNYNTIKNHKWPVLTNLQIIWRL